jgi:magnesium chelatase family protein
MLASRIPSILPVLSARERIETLRIHSIVGNPIENLLAGIRPFRAPHHLISDAGLIGGGPIPRPGELTLAHRGVLFLDEFPEFRRSAIEALRAPLENRSVSVSRARAREIFPANFQLVAAMNPCPCGRLGAPGQSCLCSRTTIAKYLGKLSLPILDRIDLQVDLQPVPPSLLTSPTSQPTKQCETRDRVALAHQRQADRSKKLNSELSGEELKQIAQLNSNATKLLTRVVAKQNLSARGFAKILRVSRTIADLEESESVTDQHLAEALSFRALERIREYVDSGY